MFRILLICLSIILLLGCGHVTRKQNGHNYRFDEFPLGHDLNPIETSHQSVN